MPGGGHDIGSSHGDMPIHPYHGMGQDINPTRVEAHDSAKDNIIIHPLRPGEPPSPHLLQDIANGKEVGFVLPQGRGVHTSTMGLELGKTEQGLDALKVFAIYPQGNERRFEIPLPHGTSPNDIAHAMHEIPDIQAAMKLERQPEKPQGPFDFLRIRRPSEIYTHYPPGRDHNPTMYINPEDLKRGIWTQPDDTRQVPNIRPDSLPPSSTRVETPQPPSRMETPRSPSHIEAHSAPNFSFDIAGVKGDGRATIIPPTDTTRHSQLCVEYNNQTYYLNLPSTDRKAVKETLRHFITNRVSHHLKEIGEEPALLSQMDNFAQRIKDQYRNMFSDQ